MISLKGIRQGVGVFKLKRERKRLKRKKHAFSIEKASSIGVIYDATNRSDAETVKKFVQYLKEERKEVLSLGYINSKDSSDIVKPHLNYRFIDNRDLSYFLIPKGDDVESFMSKSFSILIDLNLKDSFVSKYITTLSPSKFKVGAVGNYRGEVCDLTIDISGNETLEYLIIQLKHYLKMIKN